MRGLRRDKSRQFHASDRLAPKRTARGDRGSRRTCRRAPQQLRQQAHKLGAHCMRIGTHCECNDAFGRSD
jgi:hypothetical protein